MPRISGPNVSAWVISGITIKKLKTPIYTPIRAAGIAPERIAYGIESIEAQAMPTPTIEATNIQGLLMKKTDNSPRAPQIKQIAWTTRRLVAFASFGSRKATAKQVMFMNDIAN